MENPNSKIIASGIGLVEGRRFYEEENTYGFISKKYLDLNIKDSIFTEIKIDQPLEKLSIKSFRQKNNKFG